MLVVVLVLLLGSAVQATSAGDERVTVDYRVRSGDTLWAIAEEHGPRGHDVRDVISVIRSLNDVDGSLIYPGQVLRIPVVADG
jgi:LysM repeat protein